MSPALAIAPVTAPELSQTSFEALYRESRDDVYAYVAGLLRDRSAAEEVTAQAFERAWRRRTQLDPARGSARGWLFGIARNAALDEMRHAGRRVAMPPESDPAGASRRGGANPPAESGSLESPGSDPAELAVNRAFLRAALAQLSGRERELVALKFFGGLSNAEIAEVLGVSESNAGTRLHRIVEKLRRSVNETG